MAVAVAAAVAEGFGTRAGNARLSFETACGSLYEAQAALRVASAWGYVRPAEISLVLEALDRIASRLYGLSRR